MPARYTLQNHPAFDEPLSRQDLYMLVARGSLARGEMCISEETGHTHTVGEVIHELGGGRKLPRSRMHRPAYREIAPDLDNYEEVRHAEETLAKARTNSPIRGDLEDLEDGEDAFEDSANQTETEDDLADPESGAEDLTDDEPTDESVAADRPLTPSGEVILHHSHPSWLGYTKALLLVLLLLIVSGMLLAIQLEYAIIAVLCASSTLIVVGIARYSRDYIVTRERVELIWGIIGRSSKEARICDIRSIDVYEEGIKGFLGLGTIDFSTAANAGIEVQFKDLRQAHKVKDLVRKLQKGVDPTND